MTSRDFCYWLNGFMELSKVNTIDAIQFEQIKNHLNLVFVHEIDPSFGDETKQLELNQVHKGLSDIKFRC